MKKVLLWLWQFPQNIAGWVLSRRAERWPYICNDGKEYRIYFLSLFRAGVSLGNYVIFDPIYKKYIDLLDVAVKHEHGHQIQSMYLGPLYLIIIGLPSMLGNIYSRVFHKDSEWYYSQPWEKSADKLGGVER